MAQYDQDLTQEEFQNNINGSDLSTETKSKILELIGTDGTVNVKTWDGLTPATAGDAPAQVLIVSPTILPGSDGTTVLDLPADLLGSVKTWVFDTTENISANFNTIDRVIVGGSGENTFVVNGDHDTTIVGNNKTDTFTTTGGNDRIEAGTGTTTVNTGAGFDIVVAKGSADDYDVTIVDGALVLKSKAGAGVADTTITAKDVNFIEFSNTVGGSLADNKSIAIVGDAASATVVRLYDGLLGRNAESSGAKFWVDAQAKGTSLETIATAFLNSTEFQTAHANLSNEQFVSLLYTQGLQRTDAGAADAEGVKFWVDALNNNVSRAEVAVGIVGSAEATTGTDAHIKIVDGLV
ncbi:DUF4214 domain-containing protein [Pigmentiphaga aceris]|uniref:DUF4214 domain-containing protein n=1 Tax=Pigmentiphaga aceris TaxID=1940612 RepID=A0A5C0B3H1_9BURK|nr:DUF4214 domain-containing protein [Pigmentiphaga aceris]QEI08386.1 DUF4214 domain-containing protein [Pigmentiphaga aceris]